MTRLAFFWLVAARAGLSAGQVIFQAAPKLCSDEWRATECPKYCTNYMEDMCCKYHGKTASMLTIPFGHNLAIVARREWFQNCTGANLAFTDYQAQGSGAFRPLFEVGEGAKADAESSGVYDSYMTQATAVNTFKDYVEDLSPRIRVTPKLQWTDILPYVRKMGSYQGRQLTMPFDLDFVNILLRDDLVKRYETEKGEKEPRTYEEFAAFVEYFNNTDLNNDGKPDAGICSLNGAGPGGPQAMLMAIASTKLQYLGSNTGVWFDTEDPEAVPLFETPAFLEAAELTRRLWMNSIDDRPGGWTELHEDYWHNGECAAYMWLTGSVAWVLTKGPIGKCESYPKPCIKKTEGKPEWKNRTVIWEPTHEDGSYWEPRRVRPFGSEKVYDRASETMKSCTPELDPQEGEVNCPHLDPEEDERDGVWINRAPYYYSAFQHCSISFRAEALQENRDLLWDFVVMANLESAPVVAQALGNTYLDPFRRSHLTPETRKFYSKEWTEQQYEDLRRTFFWAGSTPNTVLPLSIPGQEEYELAMEMLLWQYLLDIGTDCTSKNDCKCRKFLEPGDNCGYGWGDDPDLELWARSRANGGSLSKEQFAINLRRRWDAITKTHGGGRDQINSYRGTMDLEPLKEEGGSDDAWVMPLVIALSATIGFILVAIVVGWVFITYREKRRLMRIREAEYERAIRTAEEDAGALGHPMVLCSARNFMKLPSLTAYEDLRNQGKLVYLDTLEKIQAFKEQHLIVFLSHQWLGWGIPDPDNIHHNAMTEALRQVITRCRRTGVGSKATLDEMYVWCDFVSIAQEHRPMQIMAVSSLPVYSSIADAFVIVAPTARHQNSGKVCNADTYSLRGWCRAEMLAKVCGSGLDHMYIIQGEDSTLQPVDHEWLMKLDLRVFEGQFSCCSMKHSGTVKCDKESLMSPILGLYSLVIKQRKLTHIQDVYHFIVSDKDRFFPHSIFFVDEDGKAEERELFGPLVKKMEEHVDEKGTMTYENIQRRSSMWEAASELSIKHLTKGTDQQDGSRDSDNFADDVEQSKLNGSGRSWRS
uniref:Uncharacterized protein n=1 Tax=Odontella aurita TaxID=265563 RepID=A0A7S4K0D7_9STRA|mmetsp:Transcript_58473/g.174156  ORF Transcript_58473/g.174156 Transcript_58473/m.174156 type:complete len:1042 (+) Transcript_58473:462-3587(+)